jgi:hypothetical protein
LDNGAAAPRANGPRQESTLPPARQNESRRLGKAAGIHSRTLYPSAKSTIRAIAISSIGVACASARSCAPLTYRTALNNTPTTVPTMYMAQAERLRWVFVEVNIKYSPRSAIPKLLAVASFAT